MFSGTGMVNRVVGLTGGIGSGKSTVARLFAERGIPCVDTDVIARELTTVNGAAIPLIREAFGNEVITPEGALDRARMRELVFSDDASRKKLESLLHPEIHAQAKRDVMTALHDAAYVLLAVPLLFESGSYQDFIACSLVVDCDEEIQLSRVLARPGLTEDVARKIMSAQLARHERVAKADLLLDNSGDLTLLSDSVARMHLHLLGRFGYGQH